MLRFYLDRHGKRKYTLKDQTEKGSFCVSAHPAKFSPDDQYSKERLRCKQRFNLLPTQQGPIKL